METIDLFPQYIRMLLPVFSAACCILLVIFSLSDSITRAERNLKLVAAGYFLATAIAWAGLFVYHFYPPIFVRINTLWMLCYLIAPALFYHMIALLTTHGGASGFNLWHYVAPILLSVVLLVWSFFVPWGIQLDITTGLGQYTPPGYEAYTRLFNSKQPLRLIFGVVYFILTLRILHRYYRKANTKAGLVRKPARWVVYLMLLLMMTMVASLISATVSKKVGPASSWSTVAALTVIGQHLLFTYHIIRRRYLLYVVHTIQPAPETEEDTGTAGKEVPARRQHSGQPLTRRRLEAYFRSEKPYLNPDFKITDLVEYFDLNRSTISGFINKTYGVHFARYVNRWRLEELNRLSGLPSNHGKKKSQLILKAGFTNTKHYQRSLQAESGNGENATDNATSHE